MIQLGAFRIELQSRLIFGNRFVDFSLPQQNISEVAMSPEILRVDLQRRRELRKGLIRFAFGEEGVSQIVMRHGVASSYRYCMLKKGQTIFPEPNLKTGDGDAANNH